MTTHLTVSVYTNRDEIKVNFPACWVICPDCEGCATDRGHNVECDGGGFTTSEWNEQDEDFREAYLRGDYDQPCLFCKGLGRIQIINEDAVTGWRAKILLKAFHDQMRDNAEIDAIQAAERRMGA